MGHFPGFGSHGTVCDFRECFGKSPYGRNLLLTIQDLFLSFHGTSDSPPMKGLNCQLVYSEYVEGSQSSRILMCVCMGKCLLTSCERAIQKKTLNPFVFTQSSWMLYYNKKTVSCKNINTMNSMKTQIRLTRRVLAEPA